jgi:hypothetical protein
MKMKKLLSGRRCLKTAMLLCMTANVLIYAPVKAQAPFSDGSFIATTGMEEVTPVGMKDLTASVTENSVYVDLILKGESENSVLLFEKSVNGKDYLVIGQKESFATVDRSTEILFSFQDYDPLCGTSFYRILQIKKEGFFYSPTTTVFFEQQTPLVLNSEE